MKRNYPRAVRRHVVRSLHSIRCLIWTMGSQRAVNWMESAVQRWAGKQQVFIPLDKLHIEGSLTSDHIVASMKQCSSLFPGRTTLQVRFTCQNLER